MAGLKGITVNTAPEAEPHIYAEDDACYIPGNVWGKTVYQALDKHAKLRCYPITK